MKRGHPILILVREVLYNNFVHGEPGGNLRYDLYYVVDRKYAQRLNKASLYSGETSIQGNTVHTYIHTYIHTSIRTLKESLKVLFCFALCEASACL